MGVYSHTNNYTQDYIQHYIQPSFSNEMYRIIPYPTRSFITLNLTISESTFNR